MGQELEQNTGNHNKLNVELPVKKSFAFYRTGIFYAVFTKSKPTISMKQRPSWEANISSPSQETPHILWFWVD